MTRRSYVQDPATGKLVPKEEWYAGRDEPNAPMVMPDLKPYQSMVTGEQIGGRRQHREHLKAHGVVEVGNSFDKATPKPITPPKGLKEHVSRAVYQHIR
jgi:hypothetical protein